MEPSVTELFDLSGKVALVTGATGHLGREIAAGLAEAGASVVAASRSKSRAVKVADEFPQVGSAKHLGIELNHLDERSIAGGFAEAVKIGGKVDILVNNGHEATMRTWHDVNFEEFNVQLANATGYFLLARQLRDHALSRGASANIIMVGSMYGIVSSIPAVYEGIGPGNPVAYQVLKGGVIQLTRHLAVHWAADRIRVNTLSPGPFPEPSKVPAELALRLADHSPMKRLGTAAELKGAAVFLASDASSYVTGHNLVVDGGWTAW